MTITLDLIDKTNVYASYAGPNGDIFAGYRIYVSSEATATASVNSIINQFTSTTTATTANVADLAINYTGGSFAIVQSTGPGIYTEISNYISFTGTNTFTRQGPLSINFFTTPPPNESKKAIVNIFFANYKGSGAYGDSDIITISPAYSLNGVTYTAPGMAKSLIIEILVGTPSGNPCFPAKTPVLTNHGYVHIDEIDIHNHTINNNAIVAVTQTVSDEKHLIRIAKHALGNNYPSETTLISQNHQVLFDDVMIKAKDLVGLVDKVTRVPYNGEPLYNVLLETHDQMKVNNMIVETLHPEHKIAQLYQLLKMAKPEQRGEIIALYNKLDREHKAAAKK